MGFAWELMVFGGNYGIGFPAGDNFSCFSIADFGFSCSGGYYGIPLFPTRRWGGIGRGIHVMVSSRVSVFVPAGQSAPYLDNQLGKNTECLSGRRDFGPSGGIFFGDNRDCKQEPARFIAGSVSKSASGCGGRLQGAGICIFSGVNCSRSIFSFCLCRYCHITEE